MLLTLTAKVRIYPSAEQRALLSETMREFVNGCNTVSKHCFTEETLSQSEIHRAIYFQLRERHGLKSQMAQSAIKRAIAAYKTIHSSNKKWSVEPVFKRHTLDLVWGRDYSLTAANQFSINTLGGRVKCDAAWDGPIAEYRNGKFGTAKLTHKHGKWFLHIPVTINVPDPQTPQNIVGVDLGINFLAVSYDNQGKTSFESGKEVKHKRSANSERRAELQTKNTRSAKRRLKAIGARENRWMSDINHQVSKALVTSVDKPTLFVLEDLKGIREVTERVKKPQRYVQVSWAFHQLRTMIEYKAAKYGNTVITVDPAYTSQTCPKCGHVAKNNRNKKAHSFRCRNCGYMSNDDRVAAMNLHRLGIQYQMQLSSATSGAQGAQSTVPCVSSSS